MNLERHLWDGQSSGQVTPIFVPFSSLSGQYLANCGKPSTTDSLFLPQLIFTLLWLLAPLEPGVPGPGDVFQYQGVKTQIVKTQTGVRGSTGPREVDFCLLPVDPKANHSPSYACYCLSPT